MKSIIIAPDSFKGTLNAGEICSIVSRVIQKYFPDARLLSIPMADGGEGLVDAYLNALGGVRERVQVTGPHGRPVVSQYGVLDSGVAVAEMAACAGLPLMGDRLDPLRATTYGVGELLNHIAGQGISEVILGLGGSATNDLGIGMAAALGYRFYDSRHRALEPLACNLGKIEHISRPEERPRLSVTGACDVENLVCGPKGATYVFGKQKGVPEAQMEEWDRWMAHGLQAIERELEVPVSCLKGGGAAGGMGAGLKAFLGASLKPGIELFLDTIGFDRLLRTADLVFTGEGRMDGQTKEGKAPVGIARRARKAGVPCVALCGSVGPQAELAYREGMTAIFSSVKDYGSFRAKKAEYEENIRFLADSVMRLLTVNLHAPGKEAATAHESCGGRVGHP